MATTEEQKKAMNYLFQRILALRTGNRLEGRFVEYTLEERLSKLEEGLSITNNLVEQIIEWLRSGVST